MVGLSSAMRSIFCLGIHLSRALSSASSALLPLASNGEPLAGMHIPRSTDLDLYRNLEERIPTIHLGTFPIIKSLPPNDIIFSIGAGVKTTNAFSDTAGASVSLTATCISCYIKATVVATTTGVKTDQSLLGDIISFLNDPTEVIVNALDLNVEVTIQNLEAHFYLDISFAASGTYSFQIFESELPVGVALDDSNKLGLVVTAELIISVTAKVDFTTGFDITFPNDISFVFNPLSGKLVSMNLSGGKPSSIPAKFKSGSGCVTAVLRLKVSAGTSVSVFGYGFKFEAGVYLDPVNYGACVIYQPTLPCQVLFKESVAEEIAVYAVAVGKLDWANWSAGPSSVSTLYTGTLPTACLKTSVKTTVPAPHSTTAKLITTPKPVIHTTTTHTVPHSTTHPKAVTSTTTSVKKTTSTTHKTTSTSHSKLKSSTSAHSPSSETKTPTTPGTSHSSTHSGSQTITLHITSSSGSRSTPQPPYTLGNGTYTPAPPSSSTSDTTTDTSPPSTTPSDTPSDSTTSSTDTSSTSTDDGSAPSTTLPDSSDSSTTDTSPPTAAASSTAPSDSSPTTTDSDLQTITIQSTSVYTITSCSSQVHICPASLRSEIILTKTIIQYTTICPLTQTDFPSTLPPEAAASSTTTTTEDVTNNSVELSSCETPIVSTVLTETETTNIGIAIAWSTPATPLTYPSTYTPTITLATPMMTTTEEAKVETVVITSQSSPVGVTTLNFVVSSTSTSSSTPTSSSVGVGGIIYSVGGFGSSTSSTTTSSALVAASSTPNPSSIYVQSSGGEPSSHFHLRSPITIWLIGAALNVLLAVVL